MNYKQFQAHVKKHGITKATTTKEFHGVPANTLLYFGNSREGNLSPDDHNTNNKNIEFNYQFDYGWHFTNSYRGEFIIESEYPCENYEWLKKGDLVDISPKTKNHPNFGNWGQGGKDLAGKKGIEITDVRVGNYVVFGSWKIPAIYVKKHIPEEHTCDCNKDNKFCPYCGKKLK